MAGKREFLRIYILEADCEGSNNEYFRWEKDSPGITDFVVADVDSSDEIVSFN